MNPESVFKAMSDRTRQRVLALLTRYELSVSELVELLRQPQSTVSRHLRVLREAGLTSDRRDGHAVMYSAPASSVDGNGDELVPRLLSWVADQPLSPAVERRAQAVIHQRTEMSDEFFARVGGRWDALREESFGDRFHVEALISLLPTGWRVADVGTGTGYLLPTLAGQFAHVLAVDSVEVMLESARRRVEAHRLDNVELRLGNLSELPIPDASVDLAVAMLVLHHTASPLDAVRELYRVIAPGGQVLIVEQSAHSNEAFRERMQDRWWGFELADMEAMLTEVGFERVNPHPLGAAQRADDAPELMTFTALKGAATARPPRDT